MVMIEREEICGKPRNILNYHKYIHHSYDRNKVVFTETKT